MQFIGIDLAWHPNNPSGVALLQDNKVIYTEVLDSLDSVIDFINLYPDAIVGVDAPLIVENQTGNRNLEKQFLKDFSSKKLGVYPVNRELLLKNNTIIVGEYLSSNIPQKLGINLFEVYPHATIMNCFHGKVLPYKRKQGRSTDFIRTQLELLYSYLATYLEGDFFEDTLALKGKSLKRYEDKLDALVCAYTLYYCSKNFCKNYGGIFKVPLSQE